MTGKRLRDSALVANTVAVFGLLLFVALGVVAVSTLIARAPAAAPAPPANELYGDWKHIASDGEQSTLSIHADGTFAFDRVPMEVLSGATIGIENTRWANMLTSVTGTWAVGEALRLTASEEGETLVLTFAQANGELFLQASAPTTEEAWFDECFSYSRSGQLLEECPSR